IGGEHQFRAKALHQQAELRHRQHRHVVRRQVAEAPIRVIRAHLICEGRTAGHDHNATAADLAQPNEPLLEYRISAHAAADFDDPHLNQTLVRSNTLSCSAAASSATETLGAQTEIHDDRSLLVAVPVSCSKPTQARLSRAASSRARKAPDPAATIGAAPRAST